MFGRVVRFTVGLLLAAVASLPESAQAQQDVRIPWKPDRLKEFNDGSSNGELIGKLFRPAGDGPAPFVVFLHGCAGLNVPWQGHWAKFFNERGIGFLMVDSLTTRKVKEICQDAKGPWASRRSDDAGSALVWLQAQPFARADRIAVMGQSHGGGSALVGLDQNRTGGKGYIAGLMMYPACGYGNGLKARIAKPTLILIGDQDNWTPVSSCETLKAAQADPSLMDIVVYPGAGHSFDNSGKQTLAYGKYKVGEHPASRDAARLRVARWIDDVLKK